MGNPQTGARVRIIAATPGGEVSHDGYLLSPASPGHVTVKLDNGYNVTFAEDEVSTITPLGGTATTSESLNADIVEDSELPEVWILHTGGTIASKVDYVTGAVTARFEPEELLDAVPELAQHARIRTVKLGNMWSDDIRSRHWNLMMASTKEAFDAGAAGVVITHGTDTMHYSAAAAAFSWAGNGERPPGRIVFTGSQRSSDRGSTDGTENLLAAVHWAAHGPAPTGEQGDASVIVMHANSDDGVCSVLPGCASRKFHSSRRDAFQGINANPIGKIIVSRGGNCTIETATSTPTRPVASAPLNFSDDVRILQLMAGAHMFADQIEFANSAGYDAILLHGTGLGHLPIENPNGDSPENDSMLSAVKDFCGNGGIAVMVTQCIHGPIHMDVYSKGRDQQALGILGNQATTSPDAALIKLHFLLSNNVDIETGWASNLCGENVPSISN
ncbi:MAG: Glu-tRNA(Gln) amidotransferase subunit GatD [Candidatus Thalassarchaeaceae archaeon]|jgi:glutamyl-tRNA(Gln) amidotransferase subunit D|nr:Glu-tRNA(Gln) amidotransferase subunit GatD [Candidatus Thalassarchaeaceae archaeon]